MPLRVLSQKASLRAFELAKSSYRPAVIIELTEKIEAKIRVAEFRASFTGLIDQGLVEEIVAMKLELNALYGDWTEGKIS